MGNVGERGSKKKLKTLPARVRAGCRTQSRPQSQADPVHSPLYPDRLCDLGKFSTSLSCRYHVCDKDA